jgi:hypothetical protein
MTIETQTPEAIVGVTETIEGGRRIRYNKPIDAAFQDARRALERMGSVQEADPESRTVFGTCFHQSKKIKLEIDVDPLQEMSEITVHPEGGREVSPAERGSMDDFVKALAATANAAPTGDLKTAAQEPPKNPNDFFAIEKKGIEKGVAGGLLMMVIAAVWFFLGLEADRIFFYPPILFIVGLYAFVKGLLTGNLTGRK